MIRAVLHLGGDPAPPRRHAPAERPTGADPGRAP